MGLGWRQFTRERLTSPDAQGYFMDQANLWFPSAAARDAQLPAPTEGMCSWLDDGKVWEDYVNGGWKRRSGRLTGFYPSATLNATGNVNVSSFAVAPGRPYRVHLTASAAITASTGANGSLRIFDSGTPGVFQAAVALNDKVTLTGCSRTIDVPGGESRTFSANIEALAGSFTYYTDNRHSYLEALWSAL